MSEPNSGLSNGFEDAHISLEDELSDICADLVSYDSTLLDRLFSSKSGLWLDVASSCELHLERIKEINQQVGGAVDITWLDYPNSTSGKGFCTVIFFLEPLLWNYIAIYNRLLFVKADR
jgi:hypothetical protein